jgi:ubiquinone/menaquinone biosynthesis C-methylase UbiE
MDEKMNEPVINNEKVRQQWVEEKLKNIPKGWKILDAGAGEQQYKKYCSHLNYISQDFAAYNPNSIDEGLQMNKWDYGMLDIVSDITQIPVEDRSFDAILCTEVFEHIPDPISAMKEFARIIKPKGKLILTAPFCSMTHFAPYHFYSGFNKYFYQTHLSNLGFEIIEMTPNGNYFDYMHQEISRLPHVMNNSKPGSINYLTKFLVSQLTKICLRFSKMDKDTNELMCFGYHVVAVKL